MFEKGVNYQKMNFNEVIQFHHTIPPDVPRVRFIDYAREIFTQFPSRKSLKKVIKKGWFNLDGITASTGTFIKPGMVITMQQPDVPPAKIYPLKLATVFEDDHCAVIFKPAGIEVSGNKFRTIAHALPGTISSSSQPDALLSPLPVHRLDFPTSGLLLIAKTRRTVAAFGRMLEAHGIQKRYRAVVMGTLPQSGEIHSPIHEKAAHSSFEKITEVPSLKSKHLTLIDLWPHTGRTHQLRIHMASIGSPILGDGLYGTPPNILKGKGLFLCAVELKFRHPVSGEPMTITTQQPVKFDHFMQAEKVRWLKYHEE